MNRIFRLLLFTATAAVVAGPGISRAQHLDVLTLQENGQLITGESVCNDTNCTAQQTALGERVFFNEFSDQYFVTKPGFQSPGTGSSAIPSGVQALPANTALSWDFLPFAINNASRNLFYWNGQDTDGIPGITAADVAFGAPPSPNYSISLYDQANAAHSVNGTNTFVPGGSLGNTDAIGHIHQHRTFFLQDAGDSTSPADGIYLLALHMRMTGLASSLAVFLLFGTENSSIDALDNASVPWLEQQLDLPGDYNGDGIVNAGDYTVWRDRLGQSGAGMPADGSGNGVVDQADYDLWTMHFGQSSQITFNSTAGAASLSDIRAAGVPEPTSAILATLGMLSFLPKLKR